jgi:excisionase family DNA binding protein
MSDLAPAARDAVERLAYSPAELAQALGCTRQHVHNLLARGELRSVKLGRKRLIPRAVVDELLAAASSSGDAA